MRHSFAEAHLRVYRAKRPRNRLFPQNKANSQSSLREGEIQARNIRNSLQVRAKAQRISFVPAAFAVGNQLSLRKARKHHKIQLHGRDPGYYHGFQGPSQEDQGEKQSENQRKDQEQGRKARRAAKRENSRANEPRVFANHEENLQNARKTQNYDENARERPKNLARKGNTRAEKLADGPFQ